MRQNHSRNEPLDRVQLTYSNDVLDWRGSDRLRSRLWFKEAEVRVQFANGSSRGRVPTASGRRDHSLPADGAPALLPEEPFALHILIRRCMYAVGRAVLKDAYGCHLLLSHGKKCSDTAYCSSTVPISRETLRSRRGHHFAIRVHRHLLRHVDRRRSRPPPTSTAATGTCSPSSRCV